MAQEGTFVWYDLMTADLDAALTFYSAVLGWEATDSGMPGPTRYMLVHGSGQPVGGAMQLTSDMNAAGARTGWMGHIFTSDVDARAEAIKAAGGAIHRPPTDIPGVGRFAVVADPYGAVFSLFANAPQYPMRPVLPMGTLGHVGWRELHAGDGPKAFDFYAGQFGWKKDTAVDMGPMGVYQTFTPAEGPPAIGGVMTKPAEMPAPMWLFYFGVDAAGAAVDRAKAAGGQLLMGPAEVPGGGWIAQFLDPQGGMFAVVSDKP
jgi:predicted enzyme related to lactoylglutathione lyase